MPATNSKPLTAEQKERAGRDPAWRIPLVLARIHCRGDANLRAMMEEAATDAYIRLARCFKPERNPLGEQGWQPYAWHWTRMQMLQAVRERLVRERGHQRRPLDSPEACGAVEGLLDPAPSALDAMVKREERLLAVAALPGDAERQRAALGLLLEGWTPSQAAERMGCGRQAVCQLRDKARKSARQALALAGTGRA